MPTTKSLRQVLKARWVDYLVILIVGGLILNYSLSLFLLYALLVIIIRNDFSENNLRKEIREFYFLTQIKINSILRKEKIGVEELSDEFVKGEKGLGEENWRELTKDIDIHSSLMYFDRDFEQNSKK